MAFLLISVVLVFPSITAAEAPRKERLPSFEQVRDTYRSSETTVLDRFGAVLEEFRSNDTGRRLRWTPISEISPALVEAVVAAEDRHFRDHSGVDYSALLAGAVQTVFSGFRRGASTITMQTAALLDADLGSAGSRTLAQKLRQVRRAGELDAAWTKDQILEAYLNLVTFRGELTGIAAAARGLFGKSPHGLDYEESVLLAVLLRSPEASPLRAARRACELDKAIHADPASSDSPRCRRIRELAVASLANPAGRVASRAGSALHASERVRIESPSQGVIRTTLDGGLQTFAFETLANQITRVRSRNVRDGAVLIVDNATGEVLAYVGSTGPALSTSPYVDMIQARRQAGSILKPFLYGLAFDKRLLTPASLLQDEPVNLPVERGIYDPGNYNGVVHGDVSARTALASSLNLPAIRVVGLTGADDFVQILREVGFESLKNGEFYGPSLALGTADVTLWELVQAYRVLANGGKFSPISLMRRGASRPAKIAYSPGTSFLISDILADRDARGLSFGLESSLSTRSRASVKTGTSKDMRDNWCVGYTDRFTVGVWVGNASGESMWNVLGITGAAPVWAALIQYLHSDQPAAKTIPPADVMRRQVTLPNGEGPRNEWFLRGTEPETPVRLAAPSDRIAYPPDGGVFAHDPDMPEQSQRIFFRSESKGRDNSWTLNGSRIGTGPTLGWKPLRGSYTLVLLDRLGKELDRVSFEVR